MRRHSTVVFASLLPWLLVAAAPAQDIWSRRLVAVAPGTTMQVTLAAPAAKVPSGAPIRLEASLTPSAPWSGTIAVEWERRIAKDSWQAWEDKSPGDWHPFELAGGATSWCTPRAPQSLLYAMLPGGWRTRVVAHWHDGKDAQQAPSPWCEFEVVPHAGNQQLLAKAKTMPMLSPAAMVWSWAVEGSWLGEDLPPVDPAVLAKLGGRGMLPTGTPMADMAKELASLRAAGASIELVVAAELVLARREIERCKRLPQGPARTAAAAAVRATLGALAANCPPVATPLAGQHGDVLAATYDLLRSEDPPAAVQLCNGLRAQWPALADQLQSRSSAR